MQFSRKLNTMAKSTIFGETGTSEVLWDCLNRRHVPQVVIHAKDKVIAAVVDVANVVLDVDVGSN